jgi:hypothetical protein
MSDAKDKLGDTLKKKQKAEEDLYFAEQDRQALERLRAQETAGQKPPAICPRCGKDLEEVDRHGVAVDVCPDGCGMWLDTGELEILAKREKDSWLTRLLGHPRS